MSTELATRPSALRLMADRCNVDPEKLHQTLKNTVFKGASDDEMLALVVTANVYELNPLLKEMYAFPKKGGGITPMVGVDGWLKIANRQANFDGLEVEVYGDGKTPTHATCEIFLKDRSHPVKITEYFDECKRSTDPWNQMPRRMLRNKVMIQAIRVAFGIGGIQDEDEALDISNNSEPKPTSGRVVGGENPYADPKPAAIETPKSEKPAPRQAKAKPEPAAEAPEETAPVEVVTENPNVANPSQADMIADIRQACADRNVATPEATRRYRAAGVIPTGKKFADLTDDELFEVWKVRGSALDEQAPKMEGGDK